MDCVEDNRECLSRRQYNNIVKKYGAIREQEGKG